MTIISVNNNLIQNTIKLKKDKKWLFLDTPKLILEAIKSNIKIEKLFLLEGKTFDEITSKVDCEILIVSEQVLKKLCKVESPSGVLALIHFENVLPQKPTTNFLVLDRIQDPGNVGTLIRTALGAGFDTVFSIDSAKISNEKTIRSSMGAVFKVNVFELSLEEMLLLANEWQLNLVCADMAGIHIDDMSPLPSLLGLVLGNEGQGVCDKLKIACTQTVKLPMQEGLESLNVAISGSIFMYYIYLGGLKK